MTTQVNNDFCNICNKIGATNNTGYHNLIERYDNKIYSSISNIIKSERFSTIRATVNNDYLNISLVETFAPIGATDNVSYLNLVAVEGFNANGDTTEASYIGIIYEESFNSNGDTTNENNGFIVDIVFGRLRWCDGQRAITPRGGVKQPSDNCLGSSCARKEHSVRGSNTTTTTMVANIDLTVIVNDTCMD